MARLRTFAAVTVWAYLVWVLLTWTKTAEQLLFGAGTALVIGGVMAPLGRVGAPWSVLKPKRLWALMCLGGSALARSIRANASLARRIWLPSRPLHSGMIIVPTRMHTDGGVAATGLITSMIVDNQVVDADRKHDLLQYHAVAVPDGDAAQRAEHINAPIERIVGRVTGEAP
jgi:multicomponent Na+:H+ antiporter subunit E